MGKHFAEELRTGKVRAAAKVAEALYNKAVGGGVTACIFWCKRRLGWPEAGRHEHQQLGANGQPVDPAAGLTAEEREFEACKMMALRMAQAFAKAEARGVPIEGTATEP